MGRSGDGRTKGVWPLELLALVSSNADTDLPAAVELAVSETERVGGTEKRIDVRSRTCPPQGGEGVRERGDHGQSVITHTNQTAIIASAAANWTRTAMPKPVIVARVARQAATVSPVRRRSPT